MCRCSYWFDVWACLSLTMWPFICTSIILYASAFFCPFFPSLSLSLLCVQSCVSLSLWWCQKKKKVAIAWGWYCNSLKHWALLMHFPASKRQQRRAVQAVWKTAHKAGREGMSAALPELWGGAGVHKTIKSAENVCCSTLHYYCSACGLHPMKYSER